MAAAVQSMCDYWKSFDLPELQKDLDETATDLAARQDQSDAARRKLVEQSKEFRRATPEDIRKIVAPLLKSFQGEIDSLSKRSKNAEAAFLTVYKRLIDAPDPVGTLEHALLIQKKAQKVSDLEVENTKLRETLAEYNNEFAEVKHQEVTIKQLREQLKEYEDKMELTAQGRVKEKERELERQYGEKERNLQDNQLSMAKKLGEAELKVSTLQSALEVAQSELFEFKRQYDETTTAKSDEMEIIMADLERANERASAAERDAERYKSQLASATQNLQQAQSMSSAPDMEQAIDILKCSSLQLELNAKEKEVAQLVEDVQRLQATITKLRDTTTAQVAKLETELEAKNRAFQLLEERLASQDDYNEIKRELNTLKSIEFSGSSLTTDSSDSASATVTDETRSAGATSTNRKGKSLEMLLLEKNRALQNENTQFKTSQAELNGRLSQLQEQYSEAFTTISDQKQLIAQLEEDLRSVNALSVMFRGDAEGEAGPPPKTLEAVAMADAVGETGIPSSEMKTAAGSLLPIVQSQRERFRLRAQELEAQNLGHQQQVHLLQNEVDKLRSDNVKLYEKIKFLQAYPTKGSSSFDETESRYSTQYEDNLDPFSKFTRKERSRKYANLKPYDKVTLSMGRFIMSNKIARTIAFFYTILLHILVFLVLYKFAFTESCKRDVAAECHQRFAEHMLKVHGEDGGEVGHDHWKG